MSAKKLRHLTFILHRILGFAIGLIAILVGITESLIVFQREINEFQLHQQFSAIIFQGDRISLEVVLDIVKAAYANLPEMALQSVYFPTKLDDFFNVVISILGNDWIEVYVNPYTGAIITTAIFLLFTFFTGFAWNLGYIDPLIRTITFSPSLPELLSVPLAGQSPLPLSQQIKTAQLALPDGALQSIDLTTDPKAPLRLWMKLPQEREEYGMSNVYLDQYSGRLCFKKYY
ncbi:MAG: hypothetical protein V7K89_22545 [Nostoc sp.]|uniref:PepSY domain-containing protein n=1 Tax=Nostoc sp. TaxID=1180 RepID=UPI002FF88893